MFSRQGPALMMRVMPSSGLAVATLCDLRQQRAYDVFAIEVEACWLAVRLLVVSRVTGRVSTGRRPGALGVGVGEDVCQGAQS